MAVDTPKGGLPHGQKELSWPETRQRVTSYADLHVTLYADNIPWLIDLYSRGMLKLDELITARYRLDQVAQGYDDLHAGKNIRGIVVYD